MIETAFHQNTVLIFLAIYLSSFLFIGWWAGKRLPQKNIKDYFLANNKLGALVLVFTLFATQYSGITFIGFIGKAYHIGFNCWAFSLMMGSIIVCYLIYAPKLKKVSKDKSFITPADYLKFRFNSKTLTLCASLIMIYALSNYLITQLMIIGRIGETLSPTQSNFMWYCGAIVLLSLVMLIYESIGGMLAVAWTDLIQGGMMLLCLYVVFFLIEDHYGGIHKTLLSLRKTSAADNLLAVPSAAECRSWLSYILLIGFAASIYPQAIQRIFAAKTRKSLNKSFIGMIWVPLFIFIPVTLLGILAAANFPDLSSSQSEQVMPMMLLDIMQNSLFAKIVVLFFFAAIISAIMSTADSVLLSLTSIIMEDIVRKKSDLSHKAYLIRCKIVAFIILILFILGAIALRNTTVIKMIDIKMDLLIQLVPAFYLGLFSKRISAKAILLGIFSGVFIAILGNSVGYSRIANIHIGLYAVLINLCLVFSCHFLSPQKNKTHCHA